jgi:SAM-dependent methyltransferase
VVEWFERFFGGLYEKVWFSVGSPAQNLKEARMMKQLLRLRKGERALDIPCGIGRLTIPLARMGLEVTGVDLTPAFVRRARLLSKKEAQRIRFLRCDMRDIDFDSEFDGAFNWFGSFGYFSDADNLRFCRKVLRALKPGGRFLVEGPNKSWILSHFRERSEKVAGGVRIAVRTRWNAKTDRVITRWILTEGAKTERYRKSSIRLFNGAEIRSLLRRAGFVNVELYGIPPLGRFTRQSRRLIAVGERPLGEGKGYGKKR